MLFSNKIPDTELADWLRAMHTTLRAGLSMKQSIAQATKRGSSATRAMSERIRERLAAGDDFPDAIKPEADRLPPLLMSVTAVGSESGRLPEVFKQLESYLRQMITLRREFRTRVLPAAIQFVASILIVALLITVIGMTNPSMDVLGIGLRGFSGTMVWLIFWFGGAFAIFLILRLIRKSMGRGAAIDRFVLRIPVVGSCFQSISTARLCTALSITHGTGMSVYKALRLSLDATENHAYAAKHDSMKKDMKAGETLAEAFTRAGVFDPMFCDALHNAEIAGTIAESMEKQAEIYQELASHQLSNLNRAASMAVQAASAAVIVVLIFRIAYVAYIKPLNDAVNMRI